MFVVFEGIDGSGKTTLSGKVAKELEKAGITTHQARPKGELKSRLASQIRTLARDPRNLTMSPHTELFLYIARDTQMIDTVIRPAIDAAQVVIADRYIYSPVVLSRARGEVSHDEIAQASQVAARGLWPDLVVYCDVDIETSYLRKRLDKIENLRDPDDFGRKGLRGLGLRAAMRHEYLEMAKENADSWFVVDNVAGSIEGNTKLILDKVLSMLGKGPSAKIEEKSNKIKIADGPRTAENAKQIRNAFYDYNASLVYKGLGRFAAYHLRSLGSEEAWKIREDLINDAPKIVAYGLEPLGSNKAVAMRRQLINKAPRQVARSLGARWADDNDDAWKLRNELLKTQPLDVALTLGGLDDPRAWEMRDKLSKEAPAVVLSSLKNLNNEQAWEMRDKLGQKKNNAWGLLEGLAGIDSDRAWEIRKAKMKKAIPWVILSLNGIESQSAWELREKYLNKATKLVLRSMSGSLSPQAWDLRQKSGVWAKETLTTIKNIDAPEAWALREELLDTWPVFAAKSVGLGLAATERGYNFLWKAAAQRPGDPEVIHYAVKAFEVCHLDSIKKGGVDA